MQSLNYKNSFVITFTIFVLLWHSNVLAQSLYIQTNGSKTNNIITAVPFLLITPDARSSSMGNASVAIETDANSTSSNSAKLAYVNTPIGASISYSPWLKSLVPDVNLTYLSGFYRLDDKNVIGMSLRYFALGQIQLTDANQQDLGIYNPNEFAIDASFGRKFGDNFSLGGSFRYIYSNYIGGHFLTGQQTSPGIAFAVDISAYYKHPTIFLGKDVIFSSGMSITNIGTKLSYVANSEKYFLPTNLKLGAATTFILDDYSQFTYTLDFNKLLVPTQPIYDTEGKIIAGKNPNRSVPSAIFGSFSDAPDGFSEELKEINIATGVEYWYDQRFALRAGYFYENPYKGNQRYLTLGLGVRYNIFNLDFAYLVANPQKSPLANTLRFSLSFNFENSKKP